MHSVLSKTHHFNQALGVYLRLQCTKKDKLIRLEQAVFSERSQSSALRVTVDGQNLVIIIVCQQCCSSYTLIV